MNILMMVSGTPHSSLTHRAVALGNELVKRGHRVTMVAPRRDRHSHWLVDMPKTMGLVTMAYPYQLPSRNFVLSLVPYVMSAAWKVLTTRADVVYIYKPTPLSLPGLLATWFKRVPAVLDMDDLGSEVMQIEHQPAMMYKLVAACERAAARWSRGIIVVSRLLYREFSERQPGRKMLLLSNGVDPVRFTPRVPDSERRLRIIFFGMLGSDRVVSPLLQALPKVIDELGTAAVHVEILGDGNCKSALQAESQALGLADNVHFRGWVGLDDVPAYAAAGDIAWCVTPNERTMAAASNQKVFQYQALGLATIVSKVGDLPVYAAGGEAACIVDSTDPDTLSRAIIKLLRDPQYRTNLATAGRRRVEKESAWSVLGGQLEAFLQEIRS